MKVLVIGASGATGSLVVHQLLNHQIPVKLVLRPTAQVISNPLVECITASVDEFDGQSYQHLLNDCDAVICCLGHRMTFKGIFGKPHRLVNHAVQRIANALNELGGSRKLILMSTTGYTNRKAGERNTFGERVVLSLLKLLLPPYTDNMLAADFLNDLGEDAVFSWVAVRPNTLVNEQEGSPYEVVEHPTQSPVFHPRTVSRINVATFMVELLLDEQLFLHWSSKTPVVYNRI